MHSSCCAPRSGRRLRRARCAAALQALDLFWLATEPVAKVALLSSAGALCARRGLLPQEGRRLLSGLSMNVFLPALLLSKLGSSVDASLALELWPIAANMAAVHTVGLGLGWAQAQLLGVPEELRAQAVVLSSVGNVGNLPLVLVPSLLADPGMRAAAAAAGSADASGLGVTYVMVGFFVASLIQFPIGFLLLQPSPDVRPAAVAAPDVGGAGGSAASPAAAGHEDEQWEQQRQEQRQEQRRQEQQRRLQTVLRNVFTPPVIACLAAVPVASVPGLRDQLFSPSGSLSFLGEAIDLLGAPLIPCLFLVLGANLSEGPGSAQVPVRLLVGSCVCKLIVHPLAGTALVLLSLRAGLLPHSLDAAAALVMLLVWATPTAVLVHALATMMQNGADQVAAVLFYQYVSSLATLPLFMALFLHLYSTGQLSAAAA